MLGTDLYVAGGLAIIAAWIFLIYVGIARLGKSGRPGIPARWHRPYPRPTQQGKGLDLPFDGVEEQLADRHGRVVCKKPRLLSASFTARQH